jgi:hypothetical protein
VEVDRAAVVERAKHLAEAVVRGVKALVGAVPSSQDLYFCP